MKNMKDINLSVYIVAHDWEYGEDGKSPDIGCEVIAVRCRLEEAELIRAECIRSIRTKRNAEHCRHDYVVDESGIHKVYAQPAGKWFTKTYRDRVIIEEFTLPLDADALDEILRRSEVSHG